MRKSTSRNLAAMICLAAISAAMTAVFYLMYRVSGNGTAETVYITFLTVTYHLAMRLAVGEAVTLLYRNRDFNQKSPVFHIFRFEKKLYSILGVKGWGKKVLTAKPEQFDLRENSLESLLHNIYQAELVHIIIMLLSFVPIFLIIPYGAPAVFIATSVAACLVDLKYVMIQRCNRPQVMRIIEKKRARIKDFRRGEDKT